MSEGEGEVMANMLGYAASCAVLASFLMRTMVPLRLVAILSNLLFAAFGYVQDIHPVFLLHMVLLPINVWRLVAARRLSVADLGVNSPLHRPACPSLVFSPPRWRPLALLPRPHAIVRRTRRWRRRIRSET
jgi:hypothetical protein